MKPLVTDPVVLICSGIIVFGLLGLFWAIAKFRQLSIGRGHPDPSGGFAPPVDVLRGLDFAAPRVPAVASVLPAAAVSKEVAERLESMTQRLTEMQSVLTRQSSGAAADPAGAVGQGFSPETIDKLLKIIGNVIQQVDILQKSVSHPKETVASQTDTPDSPMAKL